MITLTKILHIAVAAAWFGHKLLVPFDLRSSLGSQSEAESLLGRVRRAETFGIATGLGTLITGGILVFVIGPRIVPTAVYVGLSLVIVAIAAGAVVARPASNALRASIGDRDLVAARSAAARLTSVLAIESVLWSAALVTMVL